MSFIKNNRGVTAIEMAFALPFLLLLVLGTIDFGVFLFKRSSVEETIRQIARANITSGNMASRSSTLSALQSRLDAIGIDPTNYDVATRIYPSISDFRFNNGNNTGGTTGTVANFGNNGELVEYTVTFRHEFITPFPALIPGFSDSNETVSTLLAVNEF